MASSESPRCIALIVTTYNHPDALVRILAGCGAQTDRTFDVIVADDGSRNDTRFATEVVAKTAPYPLRRVWHPDDGFRAGEIRNRGVLATDADYLVSLGSDCVPRPDFVAQHRALAERGRLLSGSRILLNEVMTREVVAQQIDIHLKDRAYWFAAWRAGHVSKFVPLSVPGLLMPRALKDTSLRGIKSCNLGVWRSDFEHVNDFDQSFVGWGHEDADLTVRLYNAGVRRKRGFCAIEIFHPWHREQSREQENPNYQRMMARRNTNIIRAGVGLAESREQGT